MVISARYYCIQGNAYDPESGLAYFKVCNTLCHPVFATDLISASMPDITLSAEEGQHHP